MTSLLPEALQQIDARHHLHPFTNHDECTRWARM